MRKSVIIVLALIFGLTGCKSIKDTTGKSNGKVANNKTQFVVEQVLKNDSIFPRTLSFKANTEVKTSAKTTTFKASVRMVADSVIWMSITAYSYEVARIFATPDTIKYVSRTDKKFFIGGYEFIEQKMGVSFTFNDLQSLILAQSFGLNEGEVKKRNAKKSYVLSSLRVREGNPLTANSDFPIDNEVMCSNWVNPENYQVERIDLLDVATQHSASIQYLSFEKITNLMVLSSFKMNIIAKTSTEINSQFSKFSVNESLSFPFKISSKYEAIVQ
jgi:hypothetical protein